MTDDMDDFMDDLPPLPPPEPSSLIEDLREFESVLSRMATEGIRWHAAIDF